VPVKFTVALVAVVNGESDFVKCGCSGAELSTVKVFVWMVVVLLATSVAVTLIVWAPSTSWCESNVKPYGAVVSLTVVMTAPSSIVNDIDFMPLPASVASPVTCTVEPPTVAPLAGEIELIVGAVLSGGGTAQFSVSAPVAAPLPSIAK